MSLIEFKNLPDTTTPLTAENLNNNFSYTAPIGGIMQFAGATAPDGWLICDGSNISRETYADLFSAIGTTYGSGDGSNTFSLPNLKGRIPVGYDSTQTEFDVLGETGGEKKHTLTTSELPPAKVIVDAGGFYTPLKSNESESGEVGGFYVDSAYNNIKRANMLTEGLGYAHNILQPYIVLNYIIKY